MSASSIFYAAFHLSALRGSHAGTLANCKILSEHAFLLLNRDCKSDHFLLGSLHQFISY